MRTSSRVKLLVYCLVFVIAGVVLYNHGNRHKPAQLMSAPVVANSSDWLPYDYVPMGDTLAFVSSASEATLKRFNRSSNSVETLYSLWSGNAQPYVDVEACRISPDGRKVILAVGGRMRVISLAAKGARRTWRYRGDTVLDVAWSTDGKRFVTIEQSSTREFLRVINPDRTAIESIRPNDIHATSIAGFSERALVLYDNRQFRKSSHVSIWELPVSNWDLLPARHQLLELPRIADLGEIRMDNHGRRFLLSLWYSQKPGPLDRWVNWLPFVQTTSPEGVGIWIGDIAQGIHRCVGIAEAADSKSPLPDKFRWDHDDNAITFELRGSIRRILLDDP